MIRKTVLTTVIVGAGLASTAGAAFAGDAPSENSGHHHHGSHSSHSSSGCSNTAEGAIDNGGSSTLVGVLDGSQGALGLNLCHNVDGNKLLAGNDISIL